MHPNDIGHLHVIDYYLHHALVLQRPIFLSSHLRPYGDTCRPIDLEQTITDFDIATERREGWAYQ